MVILTFVLDDGQEVEVPLSGLVTLGREDDNDVIIDDERISRHHAELSPLPDGRVELSDLGSTGGTFVNGRPVRKQIVKAGDSIAFGPLAASIVVRGDDEAALPPTRSNDLTANEMRANLASEEKRLANLRADIGEAKAGAAEAAKSLEALKAQRDEVEAEMKLLAKSRAKVEQETRNLTSKLELETRRLSNLNDDVAAQEKHLQELARKAEEQQKQHAKTTSELEREVRQKKEELSRCAGEATEAQRTLDRLQQEIAARSDELAAQSRANEELAARTGDMESGARAMADVERKAAQLADRATAAERERDDARRAAEDALAHIRSLEAALKQSRDAEEAAKSGFEKLRQQTEGPPKAEAQMELSSINAEATREELASLEARLAPLRDWKKDMERRHAKLAQAAAGSVEERELNQEIDDAYGKLAELLPAARIETGGLARSDFARMRARSGVPMKSDRIRRT